MFNRFFVVFTLITLLSLNSLSVMADCCNNCHIEHLDVHPKAPCNQVVINNLQRIVKEGNVLQFTFNDVFYSKCHKAGDLVHFNVPEALYTCEGTLILPACTKIVAEVIKIEQPKVFNKNARVSLIFRKIVLPDNTCIDIKARPFTKDCKLKEDGWMTAGKLFLSTITGGIVGAGAGVGFAFIPNPAKLGTGFAIGIPVGCGVGLLTGLITPGLHYRAKQGENVYALLIEDFCVCEK
ncbi:MAG: hypothetical protein E7Z89_00360 [Cyanobacteria bacterium SIG28]|nr:hypothetical protein [Cyanobacteria bacterium SIG28]